MKIKIYVLVFILLLCVSSCNSNGLLNCKKGNDNNEQNNNDQIEINDEFEFELNSDNLSYSVIGVKHLKDSNVSIPSKFNNLPVTKIKDSAFRYVNGISNIVIPDGITYIGNNAFEHCENLENITLPSTIAYIGNFAFSNCDNLSTIFLSSSITYIGNSAFSECNSLVVYCEENQTIVNWDENWKIKASVIEGINKNNFVTIDGFDFVLDLNNNTAILTKYIGNEETVIIPSKVTHNLKEFVVYRIYASAFTNCKNLTNIKFVENSKLTSIDGGAFYNCLNLKNISIPSSVQVIHCGAFLKCNNLESIVLPFVGVELDNEKYSYLGYIFGALSYEENDRYVPNSLKEVTITECARLYTGAFYGCRNLATINLPETLKRIDSDVFTDCSDLEFIYLNENINIIYEKFNGCKKLFIFCEPKYKSDGWLFNIDRRIYWGVNNDNIVYTDSNLFFLDSNNYTATLIKNSTTDESIIIPKSISVKGKDFNITYIGDSAFINNSNLKEITIQADLKYIGIGAFADCSNLKKILFTGSLLIIDRGAFENCHLLEEINIPYGLQELGAGAFENCSSLKQLHLPSSVVSMKEYIFYGCSNLEDISLPFLGYSLNEDKSLDVFFGNKIESLKSIKLLSGYSLVENAFAYWNTLEEIELPDTLKNISASAFYGCLNLKTIDIPLAVEKIGEEAFYGCSALTIIEVPNNVIELGKGVFSKCCNLTQIKMPISSSVAVHSLKYLFENDDTISLENLEEIILSGDGEVKEKAFYDCSFIKSINFLGKITIINDYAFYNCTQLTGINIPNGVLSIGKCAFEFCENLKNIEIPNRATLPSLHPQNNYSTL